jgi:GTPase
VLLASWNQNTLTAFRYQKELKAASGKAGFKQRKRGRSGTDLVVAVPVGTTVMVDGNQVADLNEDGLQVVIAKGGKGGFGNAHFVSSTRQAPRVAEKGETGDAFEAVLELKMIADVGLVGLPNAGKSTLLASISNARPEIANYPFTTLTPNLGVVDVDKEISLLFADIPGLIEGASEGKGLGDEFLRHIERTKVLVHLIDVYNEDVARAYKTIQTELAAYKIDLTNRPQLVVLTKIEGLDEEIIQDKIRELKAVLPAKQPVLAISSQSKAGLQQLLYAVKDLVANERAEQPESEAADSKLPVLRLQETEKPWIVTKQDDGFVIRGHRIEKFAARTDFDSTHGVQRLRDIMSKMGIMHELRRQGIEPGGTVRIAGHKLTY